VIRKFTLWPGNLFILSSHLIELAEEVRGNPSIAFYSFESSVVDGRPLFTYKINEGISRERLGLLILQNEGIPDLLEPPSPSKE
jgi:DNA mismatch repair ATPase MutS